MLPDEGWEHQITEISTGTPGKSNSIATGERESNMRTTQKRTASHIMPFICSQLMSKPRILSKRTVSCKRTCMHYAHLSFCFSLMHTKQLWTIEVLLTDLKEVKQSLFLYALGKHFTLPKLFDIYVFIIFLFMFEGVTLILKSKNNFCNTI